jgi:hypothetical protein
MSNGKVQPESDAGKENERKGRIRMGIQRTLSTAKYESIVIHYEIDEEVSWTSLQERQRKVKNWETLLVQEFQGTHDRVLEELKLSHKKAYFVNHLEDKDYRPDPGQPGDFDDLESLDTLE